MRAEIIIAVRNELPENLRRTVDDIRRTIGEEDAVNIVYDGEQSGPDLPGADFEVAPWKHPRGCGQARHYGAKQSTADVIVFVDGHMDFPKGWLSQIKWHLMDHPKDVTCCHMQSIGRDWQPIDGQLYHGAELVTHSSEPHGHHYPLSAKWGNAGKKEGKIAAPMGACYGMMREHYLGAMGGPLKILQAWGGDEEALAVATWFAGGNVYLLPVTVGHMYAAPHTRPEMSGQEALRIWGNRQALVDMLPCTEAERKDMTAWLTRTGMPWEAIAHRPEALELREHLSANKARRWGTFKRHYLRRATADDRKKAEARQKVIAEADRVRTEPDATPPQPEPPKPKRDYKPPPAPPDDVSQVVVRKVVVCERCNSINSMVQVHGMRDFGAFYQANARCKRCGHKAILRQVR